MKIKTIFFLIQSFTPLSIWLSFFTQFLTNRRIQRTYRTEYQEYMQNKASLHLNNDWFTISIPYWLSLFDEYRLRDSPLQVLEIGSWEGLSSHFILTALPRTDLTCVDTWQGSEGHQDGTFATREILGRVERNFDKNLLPYSGRLSKYNGTSLSFYAERYKTGGGYDSIYIDGSHHSDDVILDSINCFAVLQVGGIMESDDYFWQHYSNVTSNPATAINVFIKLKKDHLKVIRRYHQVIILRVK